jgi:chemotaxis protein CheD
MATTPLAQRMFEPAQPPAAAGFEGVSRFWDPMNERWSAKLGPGDCYVTRDDEVITTVLGSCVAACIRDSVADVGGMNHFMLPESSGSSEDRWLDPKTGPATRYGSYAMESLINSLLKLGARRERLEVKLFGAGRMLRSGLDVGQRNIDFIRQYLHAEGLQSVAEDLGDVYPRRVAYFPATGKARVLRLPPVEATAIADRERQYLSDIGTRAAGGGDVELF